MNIDKLEIGQTYKSYKDLCIALDDTTKEGNSRKAQIKEWNRYFTFVKDGRAFTITDIFNEKKDKKDGRSKGNNTGKIVYYNDIKRVLLHLLFKSRDKQIIYSRTNLAITMGFVNNDYPKLSDYSCEDIDQKTIEIFKDKINNIIKYHITQNLNRLQNEGYITYSIDLFIDGVPATQEQKNNYDIVYTETLIRFGCSSLGQIIANNNITYFYNTLNKSLKTRFNWEKVRSYYVIKGLKTYYVRSSIRTIDKHSINEKTCEKLEQTAEKLFLLNKLYKEEIEYQKVMDYEESEEETIEYIRTIMRRKGKKLPKTMTSDNFKDDYLRLVDEFVRIH